ncbi:MAG: TPM domain-containing protein [Pseudomonadota bacterium]
MLDRITRLVRHRWMDESTRIIDPAMLQRLAQQVSASEQRHTGEVRICVEAGLPNSYLLRPDPMHTLTRQRALSQFGKLRVWDTEHNNGVLIYLLLAEHSIELVADRGLNRHVAPQAWQEMVQRLGLALHDGRFEEGLTRAVAEVSAVLEQHFPMGAGQSRPNELPDQPSLS